MCAIGKGESHLNANAEITSRSNAGRAIPNEDGSALERLKIDLAADTYERALPAKYGVPQRYREQPEILNNQCSRQRIVLLIACMEY